MSERQWTLLELLNAAREFLAKKEIENPRGDAETLLSKAIDLPRIQLYVQHDRLMSPAEIAAYRALLARRAAHEPLQLLIGSVQFFDCAIQVAPGLLIPRPETEELVEHVIHSLDTGEKLRILDIGTGTGCIAIALAKHLPNITIDAVDVNFDAVKCAAANAERNGVNDRVRTISADLFSTKFLSQVLLPYDVVVSNPPYIAAQDFASLQPEVKLYESRQALIADHGGLAFYLRIAELLPELLSPSGLLAIEVGFNQADEVSRIFEDLLEGIKIVADTSGHSRIVSGLKTEVEQSKLPVF